MMPRFHLPGPKDTQILERAKGLKIELWKDRDGDIHGEAKITCGFGMFGDDEEDFDGSKQREALRFISEVLEAFQRKPDDEIGVG